MPNVLLINGNPTQAGTDGTLVSAPGGVNPVLPDQLTTGGDSESAPVKLAIRTNPGYQRDGPIAISPQGANAAKWALAADSNGAPGAWGSWGSALVLANTLTPRNLVFWIKARVTADESYPILTDDLSVTLSVPDDAYLLVAVGHSLAMPFVEAQGAGRSLSQIFSLRSIIGRSLDQSYSVVLSVGQSLGQPYASAGSVGGSLAQPSLVRASVGGSLAQPYTSKVAVGQSLAKPYTINSNVVAGSVLNVRGATADGSTHYVTDSTTSPWADISGNGRNGTLTNGPVWKGSGTTSDPYNLQFDGIDDYVDFGNLSAWDLCGTGKSFTLEAWIKTSDASATNRGIFDRFVSTSGGFALVLGTAHQARIVLANVSGSSVSLVAGNAINDGAWHHVVCTYDDATKLLKLYVDAGATAQMNLPASPANDATESLKLGGDGVSSQRWPGSIAEARIYASALSAAQVAQNFQSFGRVGASLGAPYALAGNSLLTLKAAKADGTSPRADGATTSPWSDLSGNARNGTLTNGPIWRGDGATDATAYALEGDGIDDYVDLGNISAFDLSLGSYTIEAWVKTALSANFVGLFDKMDAGGTTPNIRRGWALDFGRSAVVVTGVTGLDSTDVFTKTAHGLANAPAGCLYGTGRVTLSALSGGSGLSTTTTYYVVNKTNNDFQLALTPGGSPVSLGSDVTSVTVTQPSTVGCPRILHRYGDTVDAEITAPVAVNDNNYHHVVATYDLATTTGRLYVDGALVATNASLTASVVGATETLKLFGDGSSTNRFPGRVAQVKLFNAVMLAGDVSSRFMAGPRAT